jgi:hypothetical protein
MIKIARFIFIIVIKVFKLSGTQNFTKLMKIKRQDRKFVSTFRKLKLVSKLIKNPKKHYLTPLSLKHYRLTDSIANILNAVHSSNIKKPANYGPY